MSGGCNESKNESESGNVRTSLFSEKEVDAIIGKEESRYVENFAFGSPDNGAFHLLAIRRAANERIIYRIRCSISGSKCFENIKGKFRVVYHIPESIDLVKYPGLTSRTMIFEEISMVHLMTAEDTVSLYSTVVDPILPNTCFGCAGPTQSEYFKYYVYQMMDRGLSLIRTISHVSSVPGHPDTVTPLDSVNSKYPYAIVNDLSIVPVNDDDSEFLLYRFEFKPEHLLQTIGSGNRILIGGAGGKSAKLFNIQNIKVNPESKTIFDLQEGSVLKVEDVFQGSISDKTLNVLSDSFFDESIWVIGTPGQGFYIERTLVTNNYSGKLEAQNFIGYGEKKYGGLQMPMTFNLYHRPSGYEIVVNGQKTSIVVPFSQVSALSQPVHFTQQGRPNVATKFSGIQLSKAGADFAGRSLERIPSDQWVTNKIFNNNPQFVWNNGTGFLGSIYTTDFQGQKRWFVSQGVLNTEFSSRFNSSLPGKPWTQVNFLTNRDRNIRVFYSKNYSNIQDSQNLLPQILVRYKKPISFGKTNYDFEEGLLFDESNNSFSLPLSANEIGVRGQFKKIFYDNNLYGHLLEAESTNPEVLSVTKGGYFEVLRHGQGIVRFREAINKTVVASFSFNVQNRCPEVRASHRYISIPKVDQVCVIPMIKWEGESDCPSVCNNFRLNKDINQNFFNVQRHNEAKSSYNRCHRDQELTAEYRSRIHMRRDLISSDLFYYQTHFENSVCGFFDQKYLGEQDSRNLYVLGAGTFCHCNL